MAVYAVPGTIPIRSADGHIRSPRVGACFACPPELGLREHDRVWIPEDVPPLKSSALDRSSLPPNPRPDSSTIPAGPIPRTLVLCFDGTGDSFDHDNSNVVQFMAMLRKDDPSRQLVHYQAGIGTYTSSAVKRPIGEKVSKFLDMVDARSLPDHVTAGYEFLMQNYRANDNVCIFGFSRGAWTARVLAGMLQKVGLLPACNFEQLPFAWSMYKKNDEESLKSSTMFKRTFSIDVRIKFVGVWDTVDSVGMTPKHFAFSTSNNAIEHFRHAIALDEHRVKFIPSYFTGGETEKEKKEREERERINATVSDRKAAISEGSHHKMERRTASESSFVFEYETGVNASSGQITDVKEVFFAGAHCDVGGGSVKNGRRHSLARIPLRWMIRECFNLGTGIIFDAHMLKHEIGLDINAKYEARPANDIKDREEPVIDTKDEEGLTIEPISKPPQAPLEVTCHLDAPDPPEKGFSLLQIPRVVISAIYSPFNPNPFKSTSTPDPPPPRSKGEATEQLNDAICPIFDEYEKHWYWKAIDRMRLTTKRHCAEVDGSDDPRSYKSIRNKGKGRKVYHQVIKRGMNVHSSVRTRMLALPVEGEKEPYCPRVRCKIDDTGKAKCPTWDEWMANEPEFFKWVD